MDREQNNNGTENNQESNHPFVIGTFTGDDIIASSHSKDKKIQVKLYDFKRPDKFSRDQIRTLHIIHETFARLCTSSMIALLRCDFEVSVGCVDQMTYGEYTRELPPLTTLGIINMDPLKGSAIIQVDNKLTFSMIERLAGGFRFGRFIPERDLTNIELSLVEGIVDYQFLPSLREAWSTVLDLRPRLGQIETNPQFAQINPPTEMVCVVVINCRMQTVESTITICLPFLSIEPIIPRLSAKYWYSSVRRKPPNPDMFIASKLKAETTVFYKGEELSLNSINSLVPGDLIKIPGYKKGEAFLECGREVLLRLNADRKSKSPLQFTIIKAAHPGEIQHNGLLLKPAMDDTTNSPTEQVADTVSHFFHSIEETVVEKFSLIEKQLKELALKQAEFSDQLYFGTKEEELEDPGEGGKKIPFSFIRGYECEIIYNFIRFEHPQVIALILAYLEPVYSSQVIGFFPGDLQVDIMERIAFLDRTNPDVLTEIERVLQKKFSLSHSYTPAGGIDSVVEILNLTGREVEDTILHGLEKREKHLAEAIMKKMFLFEYMTLLDPAVIRLIFEKASQKDIILALKGTTPDVREHILNSLPEKERNALSSQLNTVGPVRQQEIDRAQQKVIAIVRELEDAGKIVIPRPGDVIE